MVFKVFSKPNHSGSEILYLDPAHLDDPFCSSVTFIASWMLLYLNF